MLQIFIYTFSLNIHLRICICLNILACAQGLHLRLSLVQISRASLRRFSIWSYVIFYPSYLRRSISFVYVHFLLLHIMRNTPLTFVIKIIRSKAVERSRSAALGRLEKP